MQCAATRVSSKGFSNWCCIICHLGCSVRRWVGEIGFPAAAVASLFERCPFGLAWFVRHLKAGDQKTRAYVDIGQSSRVGWKTSEQCKGEVILARFELDDKNWLLIAELDQRQQR
jgi:hypothetical protein